MFCPNRLMSYKGLSLNISHFHFVYHSRSFSIVSRCFTGHGGWGPFHQEWKTHLLSQFIAVCEMSWRKKSHVPSLFFPLCIWVNLCKRREVFIKCGNRFHKIDVNLLKIHHWAGLNTGECWCRWTGGKSAPSREINLSCRLQFINTTTCQGACFIAPDRNYCIYLSHHNWWKCRVATMDYWIEVSED